MFKNDLNELKSIQSIFENRKKEEYLDTKDAALFLSLTPNAVRIRVHRGQIKAYRLGKRLRFRREDLQTLLIPTEV